MDLSPRSVAMPDSIWRWIGLRGLAIDRMTCVRWPADSTTLFCISERLQPCPSPGKRPSAKVAGAKELPLRAKLVLTDERRRQIVKRPKWLPWESSETKSDHLKKVRQQTDQRMQQQEAQKEEREKNQSRSIGSAIDRPAR